MAQDVPPGDTPADPEVQRLRAEVTRLNQQLSRRTTSDGREPTDKRQPWWRTVLVALLVTISVLSAPLSVLAVWARSEIGDTDRYVQTVAPLASDPAVQDAIAARVTDEIFTYVPIDELTQEALEAVQRPETPARLQTALSSLVRPVTDALRSFVESKVDDVVRSDAFEEAWITANRSAHEQMVAVLTGEGSDTIEVDGNAVQVDLASVIATVKSQLVDNGFQVADRIPAVSVKFTIFQSADLAKAQAAFSLLDTAATWLPLIGLASALGAIALSRRRRRTVILVSSLIAGSMVVLGICLNIFRPIYLDAIPPSALPPSAAASIYDTVVLFIRQSLRAVAVVAIAIAVIAWFTSRSGSGASARAATVKGMEATRHRLSTVGVRTGPVGSFVAAHRGPLYVAVAVAGAALYLVQAHPTGRSTATVLAAMLVVVLLVELIASPDHEKDAVP